MQTYCDLPSNHSNLYLIIPYITLRFSNNGRRVNIFENFNLGMPRGYRIFENLDLEKGVCGQLQNF